MTTILEVTIRLKRGTSADWTIKNPVLEQGEPGLETDTGKFKIGDGFTAWLDLDYFMPITNTTTDANAVMQALIDHVNSLTPHSIYDDGPSLALLYENSKVG